ncbi:MAG TPA: MBL fold metallo-hydrolase [Kofleriaceae bacterium]|jgi:L-ascorbate metabolism protein UlaG (beta-lactamase superfamily)|nr:MBL fold metallo-hydrolase [Kofleriaceae bacterium]
MRMWLCLLVACAAPKPPLTLTYLGVAGWQIESGSATLVTDPYFTRPDLTKPAVSDPAAIAAHAPRHVDAIVVGHSHVDHLLDAPPLALATHAQLIGSETTIRYAKVAGVPDDLLVSIKGGEDYDFGAFSIRVIASLHSALDHKHARPPLAFDDFAEGGTFAYLVRIAGRQILVLDTANFIERELEGIHPDIAIIAPGLRGEIYDYTCRLLRVLGDPPLVYATHFDDWQHAPIDHVDDDTRAFAGEVTRCSPRTTVVIPKHFSPMRVP